MKSEPRNVNSVCHVSVSQSVSQASFINNGRVLSFLPAPTVRPTYGGRSLDRLIYSDTPAKTWSFMASKIVSFFIHPASGGSSSLLSIPSDPAAQKSNFFNQRGEVGSAQPSELRGGEYYYDYYGRAYFLHLPSCQRSFVEGAGERERKAAANETAIYATFIKNLPI